MKVILYVRIYRILFIIYHYNIIYIIYILLLVVNFFSKRSILDVGNVLNTSLERIYQYLFFSNCSLFDILFCWSSLYTSGIRNLVNLDLAVFPTYSSFNIIKGYFCEIVRHPTKKESPHKLKGQLGE